MEDSGGPGDGGERPLFQSRRRQQRERRSPVPLVVGLALLLLTSGAIWFWLRSGEPDSTPSPTVATDPAPAEPAEPVLDLPDLDASDAVLRDVLARLSDHPEWSRWLVTDDMVRRFVAAVVNVAEGDSPRSHVDFLQPEDPFQTTESGDRVSIDPRSYLRYDLFAETFVSVDTDNAARFYRLLHPLFEEAHRELGLREREFDDSFALAMGNLLAIEVPEGDIELAPVESVFEFSDPEMEMLSPAQKHMVRFGPRNARQVQTKLRQLAATIGIPPRTATEMAPGS